MQACGKLGGFRGMLPRGNFDFGPFIRRNLVESGTVFASFIVSLKPLLIYISNKIPLLLVN